MENEMLGYQRLAAGILRRAIVDASRNWETIKDGSSREQARLCSLRALRFILVDEDESTFNIVAELLGVKEQGLRERSLETVALRMKGRPSPKIEQIMSVPIDLEDEDEDAEEEPMPCED